jgi:hypothetical protein
MALEHYEGTKEIDLDSIDIEELRWK